MRDLRLAEAVIGNASLLLLMIVSSLFLSAFSALQAGSDPALIVVPDDHATIQEAIDAASPDESILVKSGTYGEHVTINKSLTLTGEGWSTTIVDGGGLGTVISVTAGNVTLGGFSVRHGESGIVVLLSRNCRIQNNFVEDMSYQGIFVNQSQNCTLRRNRVSGSAGYGINVKASQYILIDENVASGNLLDGIGLLNSGECMIVRNTVNDNHYFGIWLDSSINNLLYHNNFFGNDRHVSSNNRYNTWDNSLEGNYWSNYTGLDADGDGVGDEAYIVDRPTLQQDRFPLMRPFVNEGYLSVDTEPPAATFTHAPERPLVNETVGFDASESTDSVGKNAIVSYSWDFGDGATGVGVRVDHTYSAPGNHTVVLSAVDAAGNVGHATVEVLVREEDAGGGQPIATVLLGALLVVGMIGVLYFVRRKRST